MYPKQSPYFSHQMEEQGQVTSSDHYTGPSFSSVFPSSQSEESQQTEVNVQPEDQQQPNNGLRRWHWQPSLVYQRFNINVTSLGSTDVWSCISVLLTFWFFASVILILGFYGSFNLQLGPNCSYLIEGNPFFVNSIKARQRDDQTAGPMLYGFHESPLLDVKSTWFQNNTASVKPGFHKEWAYFLNAGSRVEVSYDVKFPGSASLFLVIAQGRQNLLEWIDSPSYNTTMSWNIIYGNGKIAQDIKESDTYFVAVGNLNLEIVEVCLNITIMSLLYNTTNAHFKCLLNHICSFKLILLKPNAAVLTSPGPPEVKIDDDWFIQVSFEPQWVTYCGIVAAMIFVLYRCYNQLQPNSGDEVGNQVNATIAGREPLLSNKNNDHSSWDSSYDSIPSDGDQGLQEKILEGSLEGEVSREGEIHSPDTCRLCAICLDSPRDCFFLPCGHSAACFSCGSRIAEEAGTCPICRRKMKKVRKIFSV
ncbi:E3 ubiquitin-protein ligase APD2 isoform X2 [Beta vulgaris subsp. vulgaris]|uniref:E3 ubiquitin-protein ligase APD2 isoform X2 n=1 Tax=Beta vulgaris subsp. vulgaris TaxID=3555 RepID=UPI00053F3249|nr:E3 ubiquitin-protein ligase APD2 isoform X2 [Beta vulgaris subsp. vulgaris]